MGFHIPIVPYKARVNSNLNQGLPGCTSFSIFIGILGADEAGRGMVVCDADAGQVGVADLRRVPYTVVVGVVGGFQGVSRIEIRGVDDDSQADLIS